jgi:capsular exopolysaccharide synthesis family protein
MSTVSAPPHSAKAPSSLHGSEDHVAERRTLRDYYIILRERLWIALPIALLVALPVAYVKSKEIPLYRSTATMQFDRPDRVLGPAASISDPSVQNELEMNSNLDLLKSGKLRELVTRSLTPDEIKLLQRPYLRDGLTPPGPGDLVGGIAVGSIRNSLTVSITATNRDGEGAALIANRYVDQFIRHLVERAGGVSDYANEFLKTRAEELRKESEASETRLQEYKRRHNLVSLSASVDIVAERLKTINGTLTAERIRRLDLEVVVGQIEKIRAASGNLLEVQYISNYGNIAALRSQRAELAKTQSILGERYLERHPRMIDLANSLSALDEQIGQNVGQAISDLQTQLRKVRESEASYQREYNEAEKDQLRLGELSVEFKSLERQAEVAKNAYIGILDRLNTAVSDKNLAKVPVRTLDRALPAGAPFQPNVPQIVKQAVGLGVVVFALVAIGLSFLDDRVKSAWDIENFIGAPLLGIIPELSDTPDTEKHALVSLNKTSPGSEAFLSAYSAVKIQSKLDFPKSILVTSTIPGEGKTMISCNLAAAFSRHGKRVLLIDCDMRRPMLHRNFKLTNEAGLISWFEAGAKTPDDPLADATLGIAKVEENLWLLRSGGRSKSPTELLEMPAFTQFLASLKQHFDLVVVDSPPMGAVTDALLIAERTDEVVYVCRFNRAYRKHIRLYIKQLKDSKNELLGIVLNGLSPRRIEYYSNYRYYRSYKKYYGSQS